MAINFTDSRRPSFRSGVSAFTPLGYADAPAAEASPSQDLAAAAPPLMPYLAAVRAGREWSPAFGLSMRF